MEGPHKEASGKQNSEHQERLEELQSVKSGNTSAGVKNEINHHNKTQDTNQLKINNNGHKSYSIPRSDAGCLMSYPKERESTANKGYLVYYYYYYYYYYY